MSPEWIAYIAGLFDGEGHIHIEKNGTLEVGITNKNIDILQKIVATFGGYLHRKKNKYGYYGIVRFKNGSAINFLKTIYPYVQIRKEQVKYAIEYGENNREEKEKYRYLVNATLRYEDQGHTQKID